MVSGRVRLRARGDRARLHRRDVRGREAGDAGDGVRQRILVAGELHHADGDGDHRRIRGRVVAAGRAADAVAGVDSEDGARRGGVRGGVRDAVVAVSWGLSLVFTGLLVREIVKRIDVDYRAIGAAAYLGLGSVWALGLSSSAALLQATKSSIPASLLPITGVIPLTQTIFLPQSMAMAAVLVIVSVIVAYVSAPREGEARTAKMMGIEFRDDDVAQPLCDARPPNDSKTVRSSTSSSRC